MIPTAHPRRPRGTESPAPTDQIRAATARARLIQVKNGPGFASRRRSRPEAEPRPGAANAA